MPRVNHPSIAGVSKNVPDEIVEKWLQNGWTVAPDDEPAKKTPPAKKTTAKKAAATA
jgi:hypothetical protein